MQVRGLKSSCLLDPYKAQGLQQWTTELQDLSGECELFEFKTALLKFE